MTWERIQGESGSGLDTHQAEWMKKGWKEACRLTHGLSNQHWTLDPFARTCPWADIRNDINPKMPTEHHLDALDFLQLMKDTHGPSSARVIILDPPFSERQAERYMDEVGHPNLYASPGYMGRLGVLVRDLLAGGGVVLKLGFNSNAPAQGLELVKGWTVAFGGGRNDVQMSIWRWPNMTLDEWPQIGNKRKTAYAPSPILPWQMPTSNG